MRHPCRRSPTAGRTHRNGQAARHRGSPYPARAAILCRPCREDRTICRPHYPPRQTPCTAPHPPACCPRNHQMRRTQAHGPCARSFRSSPRDRPCSRRRLHRPHQTAHGCCRLRQLPRRRPSPCVRRHPCSGRRSCRRLIVRRRPRSRPSGRLHRRPTVRHSHLRFMPRRRRWHISPRLPRCMQHRRRPRIRHRPLPEGIEPRHLRKIGQRGVLNWCQAGKPSSARFPFPLFPTRFCTLLDYAARKR
jgi:hypothetical protein